MSVNLEKIRIGTRGSPLAMVQTNMVKAAIQEHHPKIEVEINVIRTSGDWQPEHGEKRLETMSGGKSHFAKEIQEALLSGAIDCAVHSMKDMETNLPDGLQISHMLPREDVRDVLLINNLANNNQIFDTLPQGAVIGTASVRRQALLLAQRPDLKVVPIRGNVQTRIDKLRAGQVDATFLAMAGLKRLGLEAEADLVLEPEDMLPAAGQGAVGIETRTDAADVWNLISKFTCQNTVFCVKAERAVLRVLDASCHTPIGAYATIDDGEMHIRTMVAALDGSSHFKDEERGPVTSIEEARALGQRLGERLCDAIPERYLDQVADDH